MKATKSKLIQEKPSLDGEKFILGELAEKIKKQQQRHDSESKQYVAHQQLLQKIEKLAKYADNSTQDESIEKRQMQQKIASLIKDFRRLQISNIVSSTTTQSTPTKRPVSPSVSLFLFLNSCNLTPLICFPVSLPETEVFIYIDGFDNLCKTQSHCQNKQQPTPIFQLLRQNVSA